MNMKRLYIAALASAVILTCSCTDFLNIVPDNVATLDNAFTMRTSAEKYLHTCYSYLPDCHTGKFNPGFHASDEVTMYEENASTSYLSLWGWYIARGYQTASNVYCNFWNGLNDGKDLYQGIRDCNIFLENIEKVPDMEDEEKLRWIDEVKFLKAYYHFYLTRMYGPIPIVDKNLEVSASIDEVHVFRNTLDECFDYVVGLLDEILKDNHLPDIIELETSELGRITNCIVKAMKAEVLIYAASPLFNGNTDYKGYTDSKGVEIFCPVKTDAEKLERWQKAADACGEAITFLESYNYGLFDWTSNEWSISDATRYMLSRRGSFTQPENGENIWYYTNQEHLQKYGYPARFLGTTNQAGEGGSNYHGIYSVPIETAGLYYTIHGLPIDEDVTWDYDGRFDIKTSTADDALYIKPYYNTVKFHYDREYRFYSDLAFDGAAWFGNNVLTEKSEYGYLLPRSNQINGNSYAQISNCTGYYVRKLVNPKSTLSATGTWTESKYYFPMLSMRSLYLYYAEALNEIGASTDEVLEWVDKIRTRSGVPTVKTSYELYSNNPEKYKTQEGLRQIIHRERTIELMFEGERAWDQRRWKEAYNTYNQTLNGWSVNFYTDEEYYTQKELFTQVFEIKDYFWPIPTSYIEVNPNLVQNIGW